MSIPRWSFISKIVEVSFEEAFESGFERGNLILCLLKLHFYWDHFGVAQTTSFIHHCRLGRCRCRCACRCSCRLRRYVHCRWLGQCRCWRCRCCSWFRCYRYLAKSFQIKSSPVVNPITGSTIELEKTATLVLWTWAWSFSLLSSSGSDYRRWYTRWYRAVVSHL